MISNKSILFISPSFFGIEKAIIKELIENNNQVDWFDERPFSSFIQKALCIAFPFAFKRKATRYFKNIAKNVKHNYDYILIVKGEMVKKNTIELFRKSFPKAKLILYLWDSVQYVKRIDRMFRFYDRVLSFDPNDCDSYNLVFRPLFCDIPAEETKAAIANDICFFGTMYKDRFAIISEMKRICISNNIAYNFFCFLPGSFMKIYYFFANKGFRRFDKKMLSMSFKTREEITKMIASSKIVLDINDINQNGLTIRTFEALLSGKKIITTNQEIKKYDFFNDNNICVVDRKNISIPVSFWECSYTPISDEVMEKYTPKGWIEDVFKEI